MWMPSSHVWVSPLAECTSSVPTIARIEATAGQKRCRMVIPDPQDSNRRLRPDTGTDRATRGQGRKTTAGSGLRTPGAPVGGDEVAMAVFHELSRAEGPSQQNRKTTSHIAEPRTCRFEERHASLDYPVK